MIKSLAIKNYRSFRDIYVEPRSLNVFVGPNASGKSNFVDALKFLAHVANSGLSKARKGGQHRILARRDLDALMLALPVQSTKPPGF